MNKTSSILLTHHSKQSMLDLVIQELETSKEVRIASAFCTRGVINLLLQPLEAFLKKGGELKILTSIMNNFNDPNDLLHIKNV
ncbi:hypothetical protein MJH12_10635, partial [bacterium]|nr:hypothetical protein [bacterium]